MSKALRAAIIDDEPAARRGVRMLLARHEDIVVAGEAGNRATALDLIAAEKPDLLFLDVQMPGGDGFSVLEALPAGERPVVIFITAYDEHAVKAFEVSAVDYLLKPYEDERFHEAVERARRSIQGRRAGEGSAPLSQLLDYLRSQGALSAPAGDEEGDGISRDRVIIKSSGEYHLLKAEEIDWIEAEGDYMKFHVTGRTHLMRETMARLEAKLDARRFVRIHRSVIVNIDRIRKLAPSFTGDYAVILKDGTSLKLSRGYHERLSELLRMHL
jgi:two-component system, LytTR family, response regulator